jgi:small subunit ribosomal protein S16
MLTIRLQRAGKKNKPEYRVVLAEKTAAAQKKFVEILGNYNPHTKVLGIRNPERLNYWVKEQHVEVSPTAYNLLITNKLIEGTKKKSFTLPKKEVVAEAEAPAETPTESTEDVAEAASEATPEEATPAESPAAEPAEEAK